jgi:PucR C-terminal helix-turn-helix domain
VKDTHERAKGCAGDPLHLANRYPSYAGIPPERRDLRFSSQSRSFLERAVRKDVKAQAEVPLPVLISSTKVRAVLVASSEPAADRRLQQELERVCGELGLQAIPSRGPAAVVFAGGGRSTLRDVGKMVQLALGGVLQSTPWIGLSDPLEEGRTLQSGCSEAESAIRVGRLFHDVPRVILYEDSLAYTLVAQNPVLQARLSRLLDPIAPRGGRSSPLLDTLEALIDAGLSSGEAAKRLGVHRHTVDYRLRRLQEMLGRSMQDGRDRLLIELAVAARHLRKTNA